MDIEMNDLQNQLKEILSKKETASKELGEFRVEFDIVSSKIKKKIFDINELKLAENRLLQKIHSLERNNVDTAMSTALEEKNIFMKLFNLVKAQISKPNLPQMISYKEVVENIRKEAPKEEKIVNLEKPNNETMAVNEVREIKTENFEKDEPKNQSKTKVATKPKIKTSVKIKPTSKKPTKKEKVEVSTQKEISISKEEQSSEQQIVSPNNIETKLQIETQSTVEIKSADDCDTLDAPSTKQEGLELWIKYEGVTYDEKNIIALYKSYTNFLESKFGDKIGQDVIYSQKGPSFKLAFRKIATFDQTKN